MHGATAKDKKSARESSSAPNSDSLLSILEKKPSNASHAEARSRHITLTSKL